jgi:predicted DNA-binding transcriptional regulator AlpA
MRDLRELMADPSQARRLAPQEAGELLIALAPLQRALELAALDSGTPRSEGLSPPDELLTAQQAAVRTKMSRRWLYRQAAAGRLPFARRLSVRSVRFSAAGIELWLAGKRP